MAIEYRWAGDRNDRLPELAADLVRRQVSVIATVGGTEGTLAAKAATATIPIVFFIGADAVQLGFVTSLHRPGGNVTGVTSLNLELVQKRLELLHDLIPSATTIALLVNLTSPNLAQPATKDAQAAARTLGLKLEVLQASTERDFDALFATLVQLRAGALVIGPDSTLSRIAMDRRGYADSGEQKSRRRVDVALDGTVLRMSAPADMPTRIKQEPRTCKMRAS